MRALRTAQIAAAAIGVLVSLSLPGATTQAAVAKAVAAKTCKGHHQKRKCKKRQPTSTAVPTTNAPASSPPTTTVPPTVSPPVPHTLSVAVDGSGFGVVESSPAGIRCPSPSCSATFAPGTTVTLTPAPETGSAFDHWSGACSGSGPCHVTMDADRFVTASFSSDLRTLTVQVTSGLTTASNGGAVTSETGSINCRESSGTCAEQFPSGAVVDLTAAPDAGWAFWGWGGGTCTGFATTCRVTMDGDRSVTADFIDS